MNFSLLSAESINSCPFAAEAAVIAVNPNAITVFVPALSYVLGVFPSSIAPFVMSVESVPENESSAVDPLDLTTFWNIRSAEDDLS